MTTWRLLTSLPSIPQLIWLFVFVAGAAADENTENSRMLASVRVGRYGGCSGTVFAADSEYAYVLSAGHCVRVREPVVGQRVGICTVDGAIHQGEWVARDQTRDLAVARFSRQNVLAVTGITNRPPFMDGTWTAVGYPNSKGPNVKRLGDATISQSSGFRRWTMPVRSGTFAGGDSGGGIFQGDRLIGVITHFGDDSDLQGAAHDQVVAFVASVPRVAAAAGIEARDGRTCPDCGRIHDSNGSNGERWKPEPNRPIVLPDKPPRDGTFPDRKTTEYIVELVKRLDEHEKRIADLERVVAGLTNNQPGTPPPQTPPAPQRESVGLTGPAGSAGPSGPTGPVGLTGSMGPAGPPGPARTITVILKWEDGGLIAEREVPPDKSRLTQILRKVSSATK